MLAGCDLVAFVGTADAERSRSFYEGTLGLEIIEQTDFACVFAAGATRLRVAVVARVAPAPYTVLGWRVEDVTATAARLAERGVELVRYDGVEQDELGVWTAPSGARVAWFRDPDGNILSVTEHRVEKQSPGD